MSDEADGLSALRRWLVHHPIAAQEAFSALAAEGRRYAATPEGAAKREALAHSVLVRRARDTWEELTAGAFVEDADVVIPASVVETLARVLTRADLPEDDAR